MKRVLIGALALMLATAGLLYSASSTRNETVIWNFVNGIKIAGVSLSQDGLTTLSNLDTIDDATAGTFMFGRPTAGTITITAKDDNANAALTVAPGGTGALTIGGASSGALRLNSGTNGTVLLGRTDAGTVTVTAADDNATAALSVLPGGAAAMVLGGASTTTITVSTDGGDIVLDGAVITMPATETVTAATSLTLSGGGKTTVWTAVGSIGPFPAAETITAGAVITANACGGVKMITAAGAVTTSTTNTFTAPAAANTGCVMTVCNVGATNSITLDNNANFKSLGAADIVLTAEDCTGVFSDGTVWRSISSLVAN